MGRPLTPDELAEANAPTKRRALTPDELAEANGAAPTKGASVEDMAAEVAKPWKAAADTYSMGLLPRALAAGDSVAQTIDPRGPKLSDLSDTYNENLTKRQTDSRQTAREYPSASIAGAFIPGPGMLVKGLSAAQRIALAAMAGGAAGNLQAKHDDPKARALATLTGGAGGALFQGAAEGMPALAGRFSGSLRDASGEMAANVAAGGRAQIGDKFKSLGYEPEDAAKFGNDLLDKGLIPSGLNPLEHPTAGVLSRSRAMKSGAGADIGDAMNSADATGQAFRPAPAAASSRAAMLSQTPIERDNSTKAGHFVDQLMEVDPSGKNFSVNDFNTANKMKSEAWDNANFKDSAPMEAKQYRRAVGGMRNSIENQVRSAAGDEVADKLRTGNENFGLASDAEALSKDATSRAMQRQKFGVAGTVLGLLGANTGGAHGAEAGVGAALAAYLLKSRGPAVAANAGRIGSDMMSAASKMSQSPVAAGEASDAISRYLEPDETDALKKRFAGKK